MLLKLKLFQGGGNERDFPDSHPVKPCFKYGSRNVKTFWKITQFILQVPSIHTALSDFKRCWHPTVSKDSNNFSLETIHFLIMCITSLNHSTFRGPRTVMTTMHVLLLPYLHDADNYIHLGELLWSTHSNNVDEVILWKCDTVCRRSK